MARIAGIDLPNKRIEYALTYIYGIGISSAKKIVSESKIDVNKRANDLTADEINKIRSVIEKNYMIEGDLRTKVAMDIRRLMNIGTYRGIRHSRNLPVRGQKTKNNSRTRKGGKKTVANKKMPSAKK